MLQKNVGGLGSLKHHLKPPRRVKWDKERGVRVEIWEGLLHMLGMGTRA